MQRFSRIALVLAIVAALMLPASAFAAPSSPVSPSIVASAGLVAQLAKLKPATGALDVQFWPGSDPGQSVVICGLTLDESVKLPAKVRIPIPNDATVQWAGEVLGGDPNADPSREYQLVQGTGGLYVEFMVSVSRVAQVDLAGPGLTVAGDNVSVKFDWVQSVETSGTAFAVRFPKGVSRVKISPTPVGDPATNTDGESLYTLPVTPLKAGDSLPVTISYSTKVKKARSSTELLLFGLVAALAVAVVALIVATRVQRMAAEQDEWEYQDEEPADAEEPRSSRGGRATRAVGIELGDDGDDPFDRLD